MKKILASLVALAFLAASGVTFAQEKSKKDEMKKEETKKDDKSASKDGKSAKAPKKKKEGC